MDYRGVIEQIQQEILKKVLEETKMLSEHYFEEPKDYIARFNSLAGLRIALNCVADVQKKLEEPEEIVNVESN